MNYPVMVAARIPLPIHDATTAKSTRKIGRDEQPDFDQISAHLVLLLEFQTAEAMPDPTGGQGAGISLA